MRHERVIQAKGNNRMINCSWRLALKDEGVSYMATSKSDEGGRRGTTESDNGEHCGGGGEATSKRR